MALETVSGHSTKYTGKLEVGQKICGYLKGVAVEDNQFGNKSFNLLIVDKETKAEMKVLTNGTAKYVAQNIASAHGFWPKDPKKEVEEMRDGSMVGYYVEIKRTGEYLNKQKKAIMTFEVACDKEDPISGSTGAASQVATPAEITF